jgi:hypothetical protein
MHTQSSRHTIRIEIANADSFDFIRGMEFFHCMPSAMKIAVRLVNKSKI